jgi:Ca2+-binding EF-hand superfamily protein
MACQLDNEKISTEKYFSENADMNPGDNYDLGQLIAKMDIASEGLCGEEEANKMFKFLASAGGSVRAEDIFDSIDHYRKNKGKKDKKKNFTIKKKNPNGIFNPSVSGVSGISGEAKDDKGTKNKDKGKSGNIRITESVVIEDKKEQKDPSAIIKKVNKEMKRAKLSAAHLFRQSDPEKKGAATSFSLMRNLSNAVPKLTPQDIKEWLKVIDVDGNGMIKKIEYEVIMVNDKEELDKMRDDRLDSENSSILSNSSIISNKPARPVKLKPISSEKPSKEAIDKLIKKLRTALKQKEITIKAIFNNLKTENSDVVPTLSLLTILKSHLVPKMMKNREIVQILKFTDLNSDGFISEEEFRISIGFDDQGEALDKSVLYEDPEGMNIADRVYEIAKKKRITPSVMFKRADVRRTGKITYLDMKNYLGKEFSLKEMSPSISFNFVKDLCKIFQQDHFTENEFILYMQDKSDLIDHNSKKFFHFLLTKIFRLQ